MAEIVFVTPNINGFARDEPVGTLLLATLLQQAGIRPKLLQFHDFGSLQPFDGFLKNAVESILSQKPRIVSFYTRCDTYHISIQLAQQLKRRAGDVYIVFAGPQADLVAADTLRAIPEVDYICCGEGETTVVPFFSSLIAGKPDHTICGLVFRQGAQIVSNPRPALIADLDSIPPIDYALLDFKNVERASHICHLFPVDVGRGCPFSCTFCSTKNFWGRKYRLKSAERIISEIQDIHARFGVTFFNFEHDMFTMDRKKVITICKMLKDIGFPISWRCSARIDCLDEELIDIMVDAGLELLFVGIESGSPRMQKLIQKNLKLDNVYELLCYISAKGVSITASFIYGFPEETDEDLSQTLGLMTKLCTIPRIHLLHHLCAFFAGTELTEKYMHQIERMSVFSNATGEIAVHDCDDLINAYPELFPHYFEYHNDFREKVKFYSQFFNSWVSLRPVYEYIAAHYYGDRLCQMLYDFSDKNRELLNAGVPHLTLLQKDRFLDSFREDPNYAVLQEVARFLIWKMDPEAVSPNVFAFDIKAFRDGADISQIAKTLTLVSCITDSKGNRRLSVQKIQ